MEHSPRGLTKTVPTPPNRQFRQLRSMGRLLPERSIARILEAYSLVTVSACDVSRSNVHTQLHATMVCETALHTIA